MKINKKLIFSILFFILMLILTGFLLFKEDSLGNMLKIISNIDISYLLVCVLLILLYLLFEGLYILITFKSLKQKTSFAKCFAYSCIEYYFSAITPSSTGGQPFQSYYMAKDKIPLTKSSIALLLNTITFKLVLLLLGIVCIILKPSVVFGNGVIFNLLFILGFVINLVVIVLCALVMKSKRKVKKFIIWTINLLAKLHLKKNPEETINKIDEYMDDYRKGVKYLKEHPALFFKVTFLTLLQRLCMFSIGYIVYLAFGLTGFTYLDFLTMQVMIAIAIDSLPFPGGVGISEALMLSIYTNIYGPALVSTSVLLTRAFSYYLCLIVSAIVTLINHMRILFRKSAITKEDKL